MTISHRWLIYPGSDLSQELNMTHTWFSSFSVVVKWIAQYGLPYSGCVQNPYRLPLPVHLHGGVGHCTCTRAVTQRCQTYCRGTSFLPHSWTANPVLTTVPAFLHIAEQLSTFFLGCWTDSCLARPNEKSPTQAATLPNRGRKGSESTLVKFLSATHSIIFRYGSVKYHARWKVQPCSPWWKEKRGGLVGATQILPVSSILQPHVA